mmetsp:Transcript_58017/g.160376  ORF Transcript_58017/g.160376 Transcript_58017/m.160376 type:complete len:97 (+) Transcript_58017:206-496(+)
MPKLDLPESSSTPAAPSMPSFDMPKFDMPKVDMPDMAPPKAPEMPKFDAPKAPEMPVRTHTRHGTMTLWLETASLDLVDPPQLNSAEPGSVQVLVF